MTATRIPTITEVDGMLEDVEAFLNKFRDDFKKLTKLHNDEFKAGNYATAIQMAKDFFKNEKHNADARLNTIKNNLQKALELIPLVAPISNQTEYAEFIRESASLGGGGVQDISDAYDSFCRTLQGRIDAGVEVLSVELTAEDLIRYGNKESKQEKVEEKTQEKKSTQQPFTIPITSGLVQHGLLSAPPSPPRLTTAPVFIPSQNNTVRLART